MTIDRFDQTPGGVRMTYTRDGTQSSRGDARRRRDRLESGHPRASPRRGRRGDRSRRPRTGRRPSPYLGVAYLRGRRRDEPVRAGGDRDPRRLRRGNQRRQRPDHHHRRRRDSARQLHRPRVRARRPHRGARPRNTRRLRLDRALPVDAAPIIDGREVGYCKLVVDRTTRTLVGCHIVGDRAVELAQIAAIAMTSGMQIGQFARMLASRPTQTSSTGRPSGLSSTWATTSLRAGTPNPPLTTPLQSSGQDVPHPAGRHGSRRPQRQLRSRSRRASRHRGLVERPRVARTVCAHRSRRPISGVT